MKLIVANWKMNGNHTFLKQYTTALQQIQTTNFVLCPPFHLLSELKNFNILYGAQDCSYHDNGAFTGDISAAMLQEMGCNYVILGHSERRSNHNENDQLVFLKAQAAKNHKITPIVCVGELLENRECFDLIIKKQLNLFIQNNFTDIIVAYEPIWAIGTNCIPKIQEIVCVCDFINNLGFNKVLYGGSVNASNAKTILNIDSLAGVLIGSASLKLEQILEIIKTSHK